MAGKRMFVGLLVLLAVLPRTPGLDNGLGHTPPMGWNSWLTQGWHGRNYCDSLELKAIADAMVENGMRDAGYNYINVDNCWANNRDETGTLQPDFSRFPSGMKPIISYINDRGFKFGLYTDAGTYTCNSGGRPYQIPGSYGYYNQDAKTFSEWGVEYVKMDWCNTDGLDVRIQYALMSMALNQTIGKPIFFNSCEWGLGSPWEWMGVYANSWRISGDHLDTWNSTASIIELMANVAPYGSPGGWNDPDFLMTGGMGCESIDAGSHCPGQTDTEYRTEFTLWAVLPAPLIVTTDVRNLSAIMKEVLLNTELIAVNQDPLGKPGGRTGFFNCSEGPKVCQIWARELFDGSHAVVLYNSGTKSNPITVEFSLLGYDVPVTMRDLWAHKDLDITSKSFTATVSPHEALAYKVAPLFT